MAQIERTYRPNQCRCETTRRTVNGTRLVRWVTAAAAVAAVAAVASSAVGRAAAAAVAESCFDTPTAVRVGIYYRLSRRLSDQSGAATSRPLGGLRRVNHIFTRPPRSPNLLLLSARPHRRRAHRRPTGTASATVRKPGARPRPGARGGRKPLGTCLTRRNRKSRIFRRVIIIGSNNYPGRNCF